MKSDKGITLVVLVITITILIILGSISINIITKSNFTEYANEVKTKEEDIVKEQNSIEENIVSYMLEREEKAKSTEIEAAEPRIRDAEM